MKTTKSTKRSVAKPHTGSFTVSYWWRCDSFPTGIPAESTEQLDAHARDKAFEMIRDGYTSGELCLLFDVNVGADSFDTHEARGWWELKA